MHAGGDVLLSFVTRRTQVQNVGRAEQEQGRQHNTGEQAAEHSMQEAGNQGGSWSWAAGSCTAGRSMHSSSAGRVYAGKGAEHRQMHGTQGKAAHAGGRRREKGGPRAGGIADARRKENKQGIRRGRGGAYIGVVESSWHARQGKKNGPECWSGPKRVFPIFLFAKRFNKFDLNLNSTNLNSNQTTRNKTMQSCMNANKQPHLDLEKQPIIIYFY